MAELSKEVQEKIKMITTPTEEELEQGHQNYLKVLEDRRRSCLSRWYPIVKDIVPTPKTIIIKTDVDLTPMWDNKIPIGVTGLVEQIEKAGEEIGYPFFFRTGITSNKHDWKDSCFIKSPEDIPSAMYNLVEFSGMVDLPMDIWVVREMLNTKHWFTAFWGNMPITLERRYFVKDGKVICHHPYWPQEAIDGYVKDIEQSKANQILMVMNVEHSSEVNMLTTMTEQVGQAVGGFWSVDWLRIEGGDWRLIDMGVGEQSYHWKGCKNEFLFRL